MGWLLANPDFSYSGALAESQEAPRGRWAKADRCADGGGDRLDLVAQLARARRWVLVVGLEMVGCGSDQDGDPRIAALLLRWRGRFSDGTRIACHNSEMRGSVLLAAGLLVLSTTAVAQETPRVLEVTLADLDEDSLDFLIGWERWKSDILDLASEGYARFTFVPLLAVEPGLPVNARFSGRIFAASGQRAVPRSSHPPRRPIRTTRAPRDRTSDRGRPRPPRGLAPLGQPPRFAPPGPRKTGRAPARGPRGLGAPAPRGGSRGGAAGAPTGRAPTGRAKPRGGTSGPRRGAASGMRNGGAQKPRQHR